MKAEIGPTGERADQMESQNGGCLSENAIFGHSAVIDLKLKWLNLCSTVRNINLEHK